MLVNNQPLSDFRAELLDYSIDACDYDNGYILPPSSMIPVRLTPQIGLRSLKLTFDFEGANTHEIAINISRMTALLQSEAELFLPDGFWYTCVYQNASAPKEVAPWIRQVKFTLVGYRHGSMKHHKLTKTESIYVIGTYRTPAVIRISDSDAEVTVKGITVSNVSGIIEINGLKKTVTENGKNKFGDTNLIEFPMLELGYNEISIVGKATIEISYYPIYL